MIPNRWVEQTGQHESLAAALRTLLASAGAADTYDETLVALGLGTLNVADRSRPLEAWGDLSREAVLPCTAGLLGIRLRELHPRRTATGLEQSTEFAEHFHDSYLPLIHRAIAAGQCALVWRGWPPPRDLYWGLVTRTVGTTLSGMTLGHSGELLALVGPAHLVFVVEQVAAHCRKSLDPADEFRRTAHMALMQERQQWSVEPGVVTGSRALWAWRETIAAQSGTDLRTLGRMHSRLAAGVVAGRRSLARWLKERTSNLDSVEKTIANNWQETCAKTAAELEPSILEFPPDDSAISAKLQIARTALERAAEREAGILPALESVAKPIAIHPPYEPGPLTA